MTDQPLDSELVQQAEQEVDAIADQPVDGAEPQEPADNIEPQEPAAPAAASTPSVDEEKIRLQIENNYLKQQQPRQADTRAAEEERIERERLSLMSSEERQAYQMHKDIKALQAQQQNFLLMQQFQAADNQDRANYVAAATGADARKAELYSKNMGEVEKRLSEYRKNGVYPTRDEVLKLVLGEQAMAAVNKGPNKGARQAAQSRVLSTTGKPVAAPSKTAASTGKSSGDMSLAELKAKAISDWKKQKGS